MVFLYIIFQCLALANFTKAVVAARAEARNNAGDVETETIAMRALATVVLLAASAGITVLNCSALISDTSA